MIINQNIIVTKCFFSVFLELIFKTIVLDFFIWCETPSIAILWNMYLNQSLLIINQNIIVTVFLVSLELIFKIIVLYFYDRSEAKRVLYENIVYGVTSEPARPGRHAF